MKRLLVLFVVLVPLSLLIAGCGGTPEKTAEAKKEEVREKMSKGAAKMQAARKAAVPGGATKK